MSLQSNSQTAQCYSHSCRWSNYYLEIVIPSKEWAVVIKEVAQLASEKVAS